MRKPTRRAFLQASLATAATCISVRTNANGEPETSRNMTSEELAPDIHILMGAVNTGVLVNGRKALLFDCCDSVTSERLKTLGVDSVDMICCTQFRRPNTSGAHKFVTSGAQIVAPAEERALFDDVDSYWSNWRNRWHVYHSQPGPLVPARPLRVSRTVSDGDFVDWEGFSIRVLATPGATDGSVSFLLKAGNKTVCFSGDVLYGPGCIWELYSLQRAFGVVGDYHGFLGNRSKVISSLHKLVSTGADLLVPSHGAVIERPAEAATLLESRLNDLLRNYAAITALNHYFPKLFEDMKDDPLRMAPARTLDPPAWIRRVACTSFAVISETGAAFLIDCGAETVIDKLNRWISEKSISCVEGCWITHYHDDHVDALQRFVTAFGSPIVAERHLAEILEHPSRFMLPCIAPCPVPVARTAKDGESWTWHEFKFTAYHFPGQTLYHGGLLVEGYGAKAFFAGDSGAPTGLDDYTCGNRMFLGEGRGSRRCLAIWRDTKPDFIFNEHQDRAFVFSPNQLDYMERLLAERERMICEMTPWQDANFALDESWARAYPYEQEAAPGSMIAVDMEFTNHGPEEARAEVEPVLPEGWRWNRNRSKSSITVPARTDGVTAPFGANPDKAARIWLEVGEATPAGIHVVPFRVKWNETYLGAFRHALIVVR